MEWISTDNRMPEMGTLVLIIVTKNGKFDMMYTAFLAEIDGKPGMKYWFDQNGYILADMHEVSHWMPIPELPGENS